MGRDGLGWNEMRWDMCVCVCVRVYLRLYHSQPHKIMTCSQVSCQEQTNVDFEGRDLTRHPVLADNSRSGGSSRRRRSAGFAKHHPLLLVRGIHSG